MTTYPDIDLRKWRSNVRKEYDWFVVMEDCQIPGWDIVIKKGFTTDFASVPQWLWWLIPPHGKAAMASTVHDWLYQKPDTHTMTRDIVDIFWLILMIEDGVPLWQAYTMYYFVRWFGAGVWKKYRKDNIT